MSEVMLNVIDERRTIHIRVQAEFAEAAVAALSADPQQVGELDVALGRYLAPESRSACFVEGGSGLCMDPAAGGWVLIDLPARLVIGREPFDLIREGQLSCRDGAGDEDVWLPYFVSPAWHFSEELAGWHDLSEQRRKNRPAALDTRAVLYAALSRHLAERATGRSASSSLTEIHVDWLMTERSDLGGRSPRQVLLAEREQIDRDLQYQAAIWTRRSNCPPGLPLDSPAYLLSGYGTHEFVLYYHLVRTLLAAAVHRARNGPKVSTTEEAGHLEQLQQEWLHTPQEWLYGQSPQQTITQERTRLPMIVPPEDAIIDHDCPFCQAMAESSSPMFWYLDGSDLEDEFAFSFLDDRAEWESIRADWAEFASQQDVSAAERPPSSRKATRRRARRNRRRVRRRRS